MTAGIAAIGQGVESFWRFINFKLRCTVEPFEYYPHFIHGSLYKEWKFVRTQVEWTLVNLPMSITHSDLGPWVAHKGHTRIMHQLIELDYLKIFSKANLRRVLLNSRNGDLVQMFLEQRPELLHCRIFHWAAKYKQMALLQFMFQLIETQQKSESVVVAYHTCVFHVLTMACDNGYLGILKWVRQHVISPPQTVVNPWKSARRGHVHILEWLHKSSMMDESKLASAMHAAVQFAQLNVLRWYEEAYGLGYVCSLKELENAIQQSHADVVAWIVRKQPELRAEDGELSPDVESLVKNWGIL